MLGALQDRSSRHGGVDERHQVLNEPLISEPEVIGVRGKEM
jgi:hypothetical protein